MGNNDFPAQIISLLFFPPPGWGGLAPTGLRKAECLGRLNTSLGLSPEQIDSKKPTKLVSHSLPLLFCFFFGPKNAPNSVFSLIHDGTTIPSMAVYRLLLVQHCRHCCCNVDDGASTAARPVNYRNNRRNHKQNYTL